MLTLIQRGETVGVEEIVAKMPSRQFSMQVTSEHCSYLYLSAKQFRERFFNQGYVLKHVVCEKLEIQDRFIEDLQACKNAFRDRSQPIEDDVGRDKVIQKKKNQLIELVKPGSIKSIRKIERQLSEQEQICTPS